MTSPAGPRRNLCPVPACKYAASAGWYGGARVTGLSGFSRSTGYFISGEGGTARAGIVGGQNYALSAQVRVSYSGYVSVQIHWYRNGSYLSATGTASYSVTSGTTRVVGFAGTAPASADQAMLLFPSRGAGVTVSSVLIEAGTSIGTYFDGDSAGAYWDGADGASTSSMQVNQTVVVAGIPSAETFGTPTVAPGAAAVGLAGIPSAETFGTPLVDYAKIRPVGIPSAETFGAPTLVAGSATVSPAGIASRETFGVPRLRTTLVIAGQPGAVRRGVTYDLVMMARVPSATGPPTLLPVDPIPWKGLAWTDELSKPQRLDVSAALASLTEGVVQRLGRKLPSELHLYRGGRLVFAGPVFSGQRQGQTVTFYALGLLAYPLYWRVETDLVFSQVDQFLIAKGLVDHWQGLEFGHYGIDTSQVTTSGVLRDATYLAKEDNVIGTRLDQLGKRENGFDQEVDPVTRALRLYYPVKGVDRSTGADAIVFDGSNITTSDLAWSTAPGDIASDAYGTGTGDVAISSHQFDPNLRAQFGRSAVAASFDKVTEQSTLDAHTRGLLNARGDSLIVPGPDVRVTPDVDPSTYGVGDTIAYVPSGRIDVSGSYRLRKRTIKVSDSGRELASVEFV